MRILVGTLEICRHIHDLGDAFRRLGHEVETVVSGMNPFYMDLSYDHVVSHEEHHRQLTNVIRNPLGAFLELPPELLTFRRLLTDYDAYVFQFGQSLLPFNQDYPILKQQGKKIISLFNGSDIRHWSAAEPVAETFGYKIPDMCREEPYNILSARLNNLRMAERFSHAIFSLPFQSELAVRPYWHFYLPVNLNLYGHNVPERDVPVVVHAPSRRAFKGTSEFLSTLDRLNGEGIAFELKLLENVPNAEVIRTLVDADVVLDELNSPHYAMLALEGMATGCAVVAGSDFDYVPVQGKSPIVNVRRETLYDQLKELLTNKALRLDHARRGRAFVEALHSHVDVAAGMLSRLEPRDTPFDYYPSFVSRSYTVPEGDYVSENHQQLTAQIIQRHGLPEGVPPESLHERGLMDADALTPKKPILSWPSAQSFGVREEAWGWSPYAEQHSTAESEPDSNPEIYAVTHLVDQALDALDRGDNTMAGVILQQCIERYQLEPDVFSDPIVLTALGRLAVELNHIGAATAILGQVHLADPSNRNVALAVQALQELETKQAA